MKYQIDSAGVDLIASFEGYVNGAYNDSRGFATVGFGHLLHQSPATQQDHRAYDGRGRHYFLELLHADIQRVSLNPMNEHLHVALNQHQVNAIASACFNCGGGFVAGSVGRKLNAGDYRGAADAFLLWSTPPELRGRRQQERALFLTVPKAPRFPWLTDTERRWALEYDQLLARHKNLPRRRVLRRVMRGQAARIQAAARQEGGWDLAHRRQRFASLMARVA